MRAFSWVPLLGLLAALAAAQDESNPTRSTVIHLFGSPHQSVQSRTSLIPLQSRLEPLVNSETVEVAQEEATHKLADPTDILHTVQDLVASAAADTSPPEGAEEGVQLDAQPAAADENSDADAAGDEALPTNPTEAEESTATLSNPEKEASPESSNNANKKKGKLVRVYNAVADNVLKVLSRSLSRLEPLPIDIPNEVAFSALETGDEASLEYTHEGTDPHPSFSRALTTLDETTPEPIPEPEPDPSAESEKVAKKKKGMKKRKNKNKRKKNKRRGEVSDAEEAEKNTKKNKKNKKNKNKKGVKNEEDQEEEEGQVEAKPGKKRNKNRKNKRKNKRKNRKNKGANKSEDIKISREAKAMREDEEAEEEQSSNVEEGRRKYPAKKKKRNRRNRNKSKTRKNKKNKKNKKNANKNSNGEVESREDPGPVYPSAEERAASNAYLTGLTSLARIGDVEVDATGKAVLVNVEVSVGPLAVQLADAARALTKSHISTALKANMQFKIKNKGRGRQLIKLNDLSMMGPTEVTVARLDMPLDADVVTAAKLEVREALDVPRLSRMFRQELEAIFEKDNVVQNLEHHEILQE